jgi:ribonuclease VapC
LEVIVVDTSAIVAILRDEPDGPSLRACLRAHRPRCVSDITVFELHVVMFGRLGAEGAALAAQFLHEYAVERVTFGSQIADAAFSAFRRFGKGQGHPAQLNMSDCAAYATALILRAPLLFKGDDFARTDVLLPVA